MISSSTGAGASAIAWGVGKAANSFGVTRFTRSSVHWADRMVAHISWNGFL